MPLTTKEVYKKSHVGFSSTRYRLEVDEYLPNGKNNNANQERQTFPASQKPWRVETKTNRENFKKTLKITLSSFPMQGLKFDSKWKIYQCDF